MGSKFSQVSQEVALIGEGAFSQVNGVMFTQDRQQMTYNTLQHHCKPHCRSDFLYKSALQDRSRTVWRGMIEVDLGAVKTDGYQRNDNLLLSDQARADSIPGLEIRTDDVRCTHGSTTGKVDEELFLRSIERFYSKRSDSNDRHRFLPTDLRSHHHRERSRSTRESDFPSSSRIRVGRHPVTKKQSEFVEVAKLSSIAEPENWSLKSTIDWWLWCDTRGKFTASMMCARTMVVRLAMANWMETV